jgi:hypothetical protein
MVFTKIALSFSRANDDEVVDVVKLHEVQCITDNSPRDHIDYMDLAPENEYSRMSTTKSEFAKKTFQIETTEEGYNAGRIYIIQMKSEKDFGTVVDDLTRLCKIARDKAEARTKFKRIQDRVSNVYDSNLVQGFFSLMIFTVNDLRLTVFLFHVDSNFALLAEFCIECFRSTDLCTDNTRRFVE